MTRTTITGMRGSPLPNLEAHGLARTMKEAAELIDEQARLRQRADELGRERMALGEEIKRRKHEHTQQWGAAIRSGEEPPTEEAIERAEKRLEVVTRELNALRIAGDLADGELKKAVLEHGEEWDRAVQELGEKILSEAQQLADRLSAKLAETEGLVGVHTWLESSGRAYTPASPTSVTIEDLLHERRRDLGLLDVGVVG
jgi:hypothetical protein